MPKNDNQMLFIVIIAVLGLIIANQQGCLGTQTIIKETTTIQTTQQGQQQSSPSCHLSLDRENEFVCSGDPVTGTLNAGPLQTCELFTKLDFSPWTHALDYVMPSSGVVIDTQNPSLMGSWQMQVRCPDGCDTNTVGFEVVPCASPDPNDPFAAALYCNSVCQDEYGFASGYYDPTDYGCNNYPDYVQVENCCCTMIQPD